MVPMGNLITGGSEDMILSVLDVLYSRYLSNQKFISWYSNTTQPDLGGNEDSNFRPILFEDTEMTPEVKNKGFYWTYCVEINLRLVGFNAIMQAHHIYEFSKKKSSLTGPVDLNAQIDTSSMEFDTTEKCAQAFKCLRDLANSLHSDALNNNLAADELAEHLL